MQNISNFMDKMEQFYLDWQANDDVVEMPNKQVFTIKNLKGDFRVMPCVIGSFEGQVVKAVKIIGTNEEERIVKDKISVGKALLINVTDNFVEAIFDVCALSSFRTAAVSILAFRHNVNFQQQKIGIIGTGRIGFYTATILKNWLGISSLAIYDPNGERLKQFYDVLSSRIELTLHELPSLCQSCSSVFLTTTSATPLINAELAGHMHFISSVGADAQNLSEVHSDLIAGRKIISESKQNIHFGDLRRWHEAGLIDEVDVLELRYLIGDNLIDNNGVLFVSTGTAVQDALICQFLFDTFNSL